MGVPSKRDIHHLQKPVHARDETFGCGSVSVDSWDTAENDDFISEVSRHDKIVLDDEGRCTLLSLDPALENTCCKNTLLRVKIS